MALLLWVEGISEADLAANPIGDSAIEIIATQRRVAAGREHLKDPARQPQDRDIKGAAAEVIDRNSAFVGAVEPIGNRRRGGFVE